MEVLATLAASVIGFAGVLAGVVFTERAQRRRVAHGSARVALAGLEHWLMAIEDIEAARRRSAAPDQDYDASLAIALQSRRQHLDTEWWRTHAVQLSSSAKDSEWKVLVEASRATGRILISIDRLGDVGWQTVDALARARADSARADELHSDGSQEGDTAGSAPDSGSGSGSFRPATHQMRTEPEGTTRGTRALFDTLSAHLDHRLWLVRDTAEELIRTRAQLDAARQVCEVLRDRNERYLGLLPQRRGEQRRLADSARTV